MADFNLLNTIQQTLGTNATTAEIITSIILFVGVAVIGWAVYFVFNRYFSKWAEKTTTTLDDDIIDAVKSFVVIIVAILGIEFALTPLSFLQAYMGILNQLFMVIEILLIAFAVTRVSNIVADYYAERKSKPSNNKRHMVFILKKIIQIVVFICAFIVIIFVNGWLGNGDLSSLAVTAGAGSIAIAFALQSTLTDFFSAFSIYFDRPFEIGDFISVNKYNGTVTNIGVKSTRLKLQSGEELVLSNKELNNASIQNFRKLEKRRIVFTIGVAYETPSEKLKIIPLILRGIIENAENAEIERVHFTEFGDFALKFMVSYYVKVPDYAVYLDTQQAINFAIKDAFDREGIEMAYPTSTVYVKQTSPTSTVKPAEKLD
jgi:small-conductance mechanosensitive channel